MLWYVLERYVHCVMGKTHLNIPKELVNEEDMKQVLTGEHIFMTPSEMHGLKAIVMYLHSLPTNRKNVPELIDDPVELIKDVRTLVETHCRDQAGEAVTGFPILRWPDEGKVRKAAPANPHGLCRTLDKYYRLNQPAEVLK